MPHTSKRKGARPGNHCHARYPLVDSGGRARVHRQLVEFFGPDGARLRSKLARPPAAGDLVELGRGAWYRVVRAEPGAPPGTPGGPRVAAAWVESAAWVDGS